MSIRTAHHEQTADSTSIEWTPPSLGPGWDCFPQTRAERSSLLTTYGPQPDESGTGRTEQQTSSPPCGVTCLHASEVLRLAGSLSMPRTPLDQTITAGTAQDTKHKAGSLETMPVVEVKPPDWPDRLASLPRPVPTRRGEGKTGDQGVFWC
ncbi:hypothetical protein CMQ_5307 [Grosmannia clavigera kw1407]|uniref:Uncharacterized protein n=1 Tax=Grosmannia clavigera (strain kw1407 / UAMH 11150) TaxID=655863 RepID=F0XBQ0_GROCL|nr:uncharacterized protein CMQ_5307 [Grosmannia clavigera kw1407]EFX05045.1 hypothetical protein CMQ_5307 [Grosmannia clavigera kw1407]